MAQHGLVPSQQLFIFSSHQNAQSSPPLTPCTGAPCPLILAPLDCSLPLHPCTTRLLPLPSSLHYWTAPSPSTLAHLDCSLPHHPCTTRLLPLPSSLHYWTAPSLCTLAPLDCSLPHHTCTTGPLPGTSAPHAHSALLQRSASPLPPATMTDPPIHSHPFRRLSSSSLLPPSIPARSSYPAHSPTAILYKLSLPYPPSNRRTSQPTNRPTDLPPSVTMHAAKVSAVLLHDAGARFLVYGALWMGCLRTHVSLAMAAMALLAATPAPVGEVGRRWHALPDMGLGGWER
eukprot:359620-Chlamydomonas_euryale.AAC.3